MPEKKTIKKEQIKTVYANRFISLYDIQYREGKHYYNASRRAAEDLVAVKSLEEMKNMVPDAVSCIVVLEDGETEPKLLLAREYRYPAGQFLLGVPAGLIDAEDEKAEEPALSAAGREIKEETGIEISGNDRLELVSPMVFSSPGMTDETNAIALAVIKRNVTKELSQSGAVGAELFDGFVLLTKEQALQTLKSGRDSFGVPYLTYTWMALMYFVSDMWKI